MATVCLVCHHQPVMYVINVAAASYAASCPITFCGLPHSTLQIMAVSDARQRISVEGITQHTPEAASKWQMIAGQTKNMFLTKSGIDIGPLPIMLDVRVCTGYVRGADGAVQKQYAKELAPYPLQVRSLSGLSFQVSPRLLWHRCRMQLVAGFLAVSG
eukprot:GHUV01053171.1.p1 GENE.GHUV01053171.1~~GHUV01053171.1.p1  ORF type:complete len:158 (-),score=24.21 GHUV01053171.1:253-726(-)